MEKRPAPKAPREIAPWKSVIKKGTFAWHLTVAFALIIILLIFTTVFLNVITHHNRELAVPDFTSMSVSQSEKLAQKAGVRVEVIDSIYVKRAQRGSVVRQEPKPGQKVKKGRRVMLTINAVNARKVPMPNLVGYSLRSANAELSSRGFVLGRLIYQNDIATNNVLRQIYNGREVKAGDMVPSEARIDLVLGLSDSDNMTSAPNLYGVKYRFALEKIHDYSLNVGSVVFDRDIKTYQDTLNAMVYRQYPDPFVTSGMGRSMNIYLTLDESKVPVYIDPRTVEDKDEEIEFVEEEE